MRRRRQGCSRRGTALGSARQGSLVAGHQGPRDPPLRPGDAARIASGRRRRTSAALPCANAAGWSSPCRAVSISSIRNPAGSISIFDPEGSAEPAGKPLQRRQARSAGALLAGKHVRGRSSDAERRRSTARSGSLLPSHGHRHHLLERPRLEPGQHRDVLRRQSRPARLGLGLRSGLGRDRQPPHLHRHHVLQERPGRRDRRRGGDLLADAAGGRQGRALRP